MVLQHLFIMWHRGRIFFDFEKEKQVLKFQIDASDTKPVHSLCFEIKNWRNNAARAMVKVNGVLIKP